MTAATIRKLIKADSTALKSRNCSGSPPSEIFRIPYSLSPPAPTRSTSGWTTFSVNEVTSPVNAAPMTTATARSMTLPREINSLKPFNMRGNPSCSLTRDVQR